MFYVTGHGAMSNDLVVVGIVMATITAMAMLVGEVVARLHTPTTSHTTLASPITNLISFTRLNTLMVAALVLRIIIELPFLKGHFERPTPGLGEVNIVMISLVVVGLLVTNRKAVRHLVSRVRGWLVMETAGTIDLPMAILPRILDQQHNQGTAGRQAWS